MSIQLEVNTFCFADLSALTEYLPRILHPALEDQAYTPSHQCPSGVFVVLEIVCQQFQLVAPRPQLSPYLISLEQKQLTPTKEKHEALLLRKIS